MNWKRVSAATLLCFIVGSGAALADYQPSQDKTVSITVLPGLIKTSGSTGSMTFALQEAAHDAITGTTGLSVPHYYAWVYVNGQPVIAVDPLCGYDFRR